MNVSRRAALKGIAALAVAEKLTDGGYAPVTLPGERERARPVLPPGAAADFRMKCVGCALCAKVCPEHCLTPSSRLRDFGQIKMDFQRAYCRLACDFRCGEACPTGAIARLPGVKRCDVHAGRAVWRREACLRSHDEPYCNACERKCPVKAIAMIGGFPVVNPDVCVGCGACEHVCPARPQPAIYVEGYERQRVVRPISERELLLEMRRRLERGNGCVIARNGVIVEELAGRGIEPILAAYRRDRGVFAGAVVMDKVVGRAAAAFYAVGKPRKVAALVMGEDAKAMLEAAGIEVEVGKLVPKILNRARSGGCPLDAKVAGLDSPTAIVSAFLEE